MASDGRKQIESLVALAVEQGWSVRRTGNNHYRLTPPKGRGYTLPSTPGRSNRSIENTVAELKRAGLKIDNKVSKEED